MSTPIDTCLTEINIDELIHQIGVPFRDISDAEIKECVDHNIFLNTQCIYNGNAFCYDTKTYHLLRIATIVNEIQHNRYNYNYPIPIWNDSDDDEHNDWDTDGHGEHHIRAFCYCKKNIYMYVKRSS